ncbi:MAG TPA: hypothetical protein VK427_05485 [Kofleriaceae bacterium]|nr:hypothetical protein [Kofleriaceae bacterium]
MDLGLVILVVSGLAGASYATLRGLGDQAARRTRRVLRKTRVVPIAELVDGQLACIVGRVAIEGEPIESLIERRSCVAFDTITTPFVGNSLTTPVRVTRRLVPFYVTDETGRVRVDAPELALCNKPIARGERFEERILEDGARIRIVGSVSLDPDRTTSDQLFRQGAFKARLTGTTKYPLLADVER